MFKRNQAFLSGGVGGHKARTTTYMTGFGANAGTVVRPSPKIRGDISSSQASGAFMGGRGGAAESEAVGGLGNSLNTGAAAHSGGEECHSPTLNGTEMMIDLPPDVQNANKLAQRFEVNKFGNHQKVGGPGVQRVVQRVQTAPHNAKRRRYTTNQGGNNV